MNPVHIFPPYFLKINSNIMILGLPSVLFPSGFQTKISNSLLISPVRATSAKIHNINECVWTNMIMTNALRFRIFVSLLKDIEQGRH